MKFCLGLLIAMPLFITACKKDDKFKLPSNENYGCIERVYINKNDHIINSADVATVNKLFANNNIDNSNFRYIQYSDDSLQTQYPPYEKIERKHVKVDQYVKGVRVLSNFAIFNFTKGILSYDSRKPIDVARLDTFPHVPLQYLKWMFLKDVQKVHAGFKTNYVDSCLYAELGFYQLSSTDGETPGRFVKAWRVTGRNAIAPVGYYMDNDGSSISFEDDIVIF